VLDRVVKEEKGKYLVVVEGAIPTGDGGVYCTIGGRTAIDIAEQVCRNAAATIAVGACAFDGGLVRAKPNPTGALGVHEAVPGIKVINMAGCPHNPANTAAVLVHYLTFNDLPALDQYNRPLFAYGRVIHDQCERRAHYDAGRFVTEWGDEGPSQRLVPVQDGLQGSRKRPSIARSCSGTITPAGRSAPATAASPAPRRASGTTCRRSTTACRRARLRRRGSGGELGSGSHGRGGGRRHGARPDQDDQTRAEASGR
jgi:NiFe hydrogenase small subunit HydA